MHGTFTSHLVVSPGTSSHGITTLHSLQPILHANINVAPCSRLSVPVLPFYRSTATTWTRKGGGPSIHCPSYTRVRLDELQSCRAAESCNQGGQHFVPVIQRQASSQVPREAAMHTSIESKPTEMAQSKLGPIVRHVRALRRR